jgi:phosphopantothenoylcysteine synthetase/decarboxylase
MKILITSGATLEPIDEARFITNFSTGKTGSTLAEVFKQKGHKVILLRGERAVKAKGVKNVVFTDFKDLNLKLKKLLSSESFDKIICAAAISDFSVSSVVVNGEKFRSGKIPSCSCVRLTLKKNFKIIDRLKSYAKNDPFVVGFKLTASAKRTEIPRAAARVNADIVIHNDLKDIKRGKRLFALYKQGRLIKKIEGVKNLVDNL